MEEREVWLDEDGGVWLAAEVACDVKVCILPPHEEAINPTPTSPSAIYAPAHLLATVPYFQACLSEPWQKATVPPSSCARREVILECADSSSPSDYLDCLLFLAPQKPSQMSVDVAIRLLRASDHLLYQECADVCMAYLASTPWSDKDEEMVELTISSMGLKPSSDLAARITSADDMQVLKEVITGLIEKSDSGKRNVAAICDFVRVAFKDGPPQAACLCVSVIRDLWNTFTNNLIDGGPPPSLILWNTLTVLLLNYGDAETFLADFVRFSKKLCISLMYSHERYSLEKVLTRSFLCAVPGNTDTVVLLSNSQRATLLASWAPMVAQLNCRSLEAAFKQVFTTLPLQDPALIALVKEEATNPYFQDCYAWWRTKIFKRMKRFGDVHGEIDLEASKSSMKLVKRMSGEELQKLSSKSLSS
ncbi:hypothetical protein L7F22_022581 [Adiantum nelumboides]|nr:hypothetical protein [Adiantum nelumboides]